MHLICWVNAAGCPGVATGGDYRSLLICVGLCAAQGGGSFKDIISTGSGKDKF